MILRMKSSSLAVPGENADMPAVEGPEWHRISAMKTLVFELTYARTYVGGLNYRSLNSLCIHMIGRHAGFQGSQPAKSDSQLGPLMKALQKG